MVTTKHFHNIEELQKVQFLATQCPEDVGLHSQDGSVIVEFPGEISLIGQFTDVRVTAARNWILRGELLSPGK